MEDTDQQALQDFEGALDWPEPLPLSRLPVGLRPKDPLARITLAVGWMWVENWENTFNSLLIGFDNTEKIAGISSRLYRNLAYLLEQTGDLEGAFENAHFAWEHGEGDWICLLDLIGYSVVIGEEDSLVSSLRLILEDPESQQLAGLTVQFLQRPGTPPKNRLSADPFLAETVRRELKDPMIQL